MTELGSIPEVQGLQGFASVVRQPTNTEGIEINFGLIFDALRRSRYLILSVLVLSLIAGGVVLSRSDRLYRASATVQIEEQSAKVLSTDEAQPNGGSEDTDRFLQTQLGLLKSRTMAELVVDQLNLARRVRPAENNDQQLSFDQRRETAITKLQSEMTVELPRDSRVAEITIVDADPKLTAQAANAYAEQFITYNLQRRFGETDYARQFLQTELEKSKTRLEASEKAVVDYASLNRLVDASGSSTDPDGTRTLSSSSMVDVNAALTRARIARIEAEQRWQQAESMPVLSIPEVLANPVIQQLLQQHSSALADYNKGRQSFKEDYPAMKDKMAEITTLENQAQQVGEAVRHGLHDDYLIAVQQENALTANLDALKDQTLTEENKGIEYNILRREVNTNRLMYDGLLQRFKEVSASAGVTANNISIVDRAQIPTRPFQPRVTITLGASLASGFALALLLVGVRAKMDDIIRLPADVTEGLGLTVLATVPSKPHGMSMVEMLEGSVLSEAFWSLRVALGRITPNGRPHSIGFTSSRPSEGKSTSAYATALNFAKNGKQVLLIDGDLRRPSLHRMLNLPNQKGLASALGRDRDFEDAVQPGVVRGLKIMTAGQLTQNPAELFVESRLEDLFKWAQQAYDLVIVDSPPVMLLADAVVLANNVSTTVFVVEANRTRLEEAKSALQRLRESGVKISGAILTKFDRVTHQYKY
jgi:succinoglycan biosynthesis transport protein ExoP